jgi:hypothetical protein
MGNNKHDQSNAETETTCAGKPSPFVTFFQAVGNIVLAGVVAWAVWATQRIYAHESWQTGVQRWIDQAPRWTATDAQALELRAKQAALEAIDKKFTEIEKMLLEVRGGVIELNVTLKSHMASERKP